MRKAILFSFKAQTDEVVNFLCALELARDLNIPVICFTILPKESTQFDIDEAYLHILRLKGIYLRYANAWNLEQKPLIKTVVLISDNPLPIKLFSTSDPLQLTVIQGITGTD